MDDLWLPPSKDARSSLDVVLDLERDFFRSARDLPCFDAAQKLTGLLADALSELGFADYPAPDGPEPTVTNRINLALCMLGVITFRAARGAIILISAGYDRQATGLTRTLVEAETFSVKILSDSTGQEAERWLENRMTMISQDKLRKLGVSRALAKSARITFDTASEAGAHASPLAFEIVAESPGDEFGTAQVMPMRDVDVSNLMLAQCGSAAWAMTGVICDRYGRPFNPSHQLLVPIFEALGVPGQDVK